MLGFIRSRGQGEADLLLAATAQALQARGWRLAGAVQVNDEFAPDRPCHMDLHILTGAKPVRISQNLGPLSKGCRLDAAGLEMAVGLVQGALAGGADLLILNKFGKQEADGRGFRDLLGQALADGVPVLTAVGAAQAAAFDAFAGDAAQELALDLAAVLDWCGALERQAG